ncbi:MAG TPA: hypothetical protein VHX49_06940 [Candidatus Acidoferrales bacterium]|jgi:hypothetical protein|nr:hypothetical protein [Candidatus Acidoferrales bacterium]
MAKRELTLALLKAAAREFASKVLGGKPVPSLYGATDGKAVGTFVEAEFNVNLGQHYEYKLGNAASGTDFPDLGLDVKATSVRQPQSSCSFKSAEQKVYGLGYHVIIFAYEKKDDHARKAAVLDFRYVVFVSKEKTADYQTTAGLLAILDRNGNSDDVAAFLEERNLPLDEIGRDKLAEKIMAHRPKLGYLTISNALQWRLQYARVIELAGTQQGIEDLLD